ncbi:MAG TPA: hypothetical protein EYP30_00190, partial [Archaeoglobaceae archaeon]|nr:hypothetical protein [Archaeoglobaceae archaeon]
TKKTVASLIDITPMKRLNNLLKATSEINELVARENTPEKVLKAVCDKLTSIFGAVVTSVMEGEKLRVVKVRGTEFDLLEETINECPASLKAVEGRKVKMSLEELTCNKCTSKPHKYVLAIPLLHEKIHGVVLFHSDSEFNNEEVALLEKLSENIAFALSSYKIRQDRKRAIEQLTANLIAFDRSADRLRNPLAAIIGAIELKEELGSEKIMEIVDEQAKKILEELNRLRKEELNTFRLTEEIINPM